MRPPPATCEQLPRGCTRVTPEAIKDEDLFYYRDSVYGTKYYMNVALENFGDRKDYPRVVYSYLIMKRKGLYFMGTYKTPHWESCCDGTMYGEFYKLPQKYKYRLEHMADDHPVWDISRSGNMVIWE